MALNLAFRRALTHALVPLAATPLLLGAAPADATTTSSPTTVSSTSSTSSTSSPQTRAAAQRAAHRRVVARGNHIVGLARSRQGSPYQYGASGPHRFDCSGLTMWVFRHLGVHLPHSSSAQAHRVRHIRRGHARRGDLVFFTDGGGVYHVAIYAGHHRVWHAPYPGQRVHKERIWTNSFFFGRVRR